METGSTLEQKQQKKEVLLNYTIFDFVGEVTDATSLKDGGSGKKRKNRTRPVPVPKIAEKIRKAVKNLIKAYNGEKWVEPLKTVKGHERLVLAVLLAHTFFGTETVEIGFYVRKIFDYSSSSEIFSLIQQLFSKESRLVKEGYVDVLNAGGEYPYFEIYVRLNPSRFGEVPTISTLFSDVKMDGLEDMWDNFNSGIRSINVNTITVTSTDEIILDPDVMDELEDYYRLVERVVEKRDSTAIGLFYGPPGTGKTLAGKNIAYRLGIPFIKTDLASIFSTWYGASLGRLQSLFYTAKNKKAILQIDEVDTLIISRDMIKDTEDRKLANIFLTLLEDYNWILILTTNTADSLDWALRRRLDYLIHFPIPSFETRKRLWMYYLRREKLVSDENYVDLDKISTIPLSGGDIVKAVKRLKNRVERTGIVEVNTEVLVASIRPAYPRSDAKVERRRAGFVTR